MNKFKLVIFDMDGTLLKGRTIFVFAKKKEFMGELLEIINSNRKSYERSIEIAKLLKDMDSKELLSIFRNIPLQKHVETVIGELKKRKIKTAIITNSYQFVADDLRERLGIDHAFANNLIIDNGIVTGKLVINNDDLTEQFDDCRIHSICKGYILEYLCRSLGLTQDEVIAIGDSKIDICMLEKAGLGIAFNASEEVQKHADISTNNMNTILDYI